MTFFVNRSLNFFNFGQSPVRERGLNVEADILERIVEGKIDRFNKTLDSLYNGLADMTQEQTVEFFADVALFPFTPEGLLYRGIYRGGKAAGQFATGSRGVNRVATAVGSGGLPKPGVKVDGKIPFKSPGTKIPTTTTNTDPSKFLRRSPRIAEKRKFDVSEQTGSASKKFAGESVGGDTGKYKCGSNPHSSTPVGRKGQKFNVIDKANIRTKICGREYSGHVLDRMQQRGITPSLVENTIKNGVESQAKNIKRLIHFDLENNISVVTEEGNVITTCWGKFK